MLVWMVAIADPDCSAHNVYICLQLDLNPGKYWWNTWLLWWDEWRLPCWGMSVDQAGNHIGLSRNPSAAVAGFLCCTYQYKIWVWLPAAVEGWSSYLGLQLVITYQNCKHFFVFVFFVWMISLLFGKKKKSSVTNFFFSYCFIKPHLIIVTLAYTKASSNTRVIYTQ